MNSLTEAMLELANMDDLSAMDSFVHRRHPLVKLILTVLYIFVVVSFPVDQLSAMVPMILFPVLVFSMAGIPIRTCFYKLRFILPLVCAVGIWNPILNREPMLQLGALTITAGMISFITLLMKGVLSLMASFLLIATTNIEKICYALSLLRVPDILVTQTLITYRYISLLLHEAETMMNAYSLRAPGQNGVHISAWGSFLGQLLLRSMDRANNLYQSMEMRGFQGSFYYAKTEKMNRMDGIYLMVGALGILILRFVNLSQFIGGLFL